MHVFIELWTMNENWARLDRDKRNALMARLGASTGAIITAEGIEVLGWGFSDPTIDHPEGRQLVSVWKASKRAPLERLARTIVDGGWYHYANQVNVRSELVSPEVVIGQLIDQPVGSNE